MTRPPFDNVIMVISESSSWALTHETAQIINSTNEITTILLFKTFFMKITYSFPPESSPPCPESPTESSPEPEPDPLPESDPPPL